MQRLLLTLCVKFCTKRLKLSALLLLGRYDGGGGGGGGGVGGGEGV